MKWTMRERLEFGVVSAVVGLFLLVVCVVLLPSCTSHFHLVTIEVGGGRAKRVTSRPATSQPAESFTERAVDVDSVMDLILEDLQR